MENNTFLYFCRKDIAKCIAESWKSLVYHRHVQPCHLVPTLWLIDPFLDLFLAPNWLCSITKQNKSNQMLTPLSLSALFPAIQQARIILIPKLSRSWKAGFWCKIGYERCLSMVQVQLVKLQIMALFCLGGDSYKVCKDPVCNGCKWG